jgi:hypothetical protein
MNMRFALRAAKTPTRTWRPVAAAATSSALVLTALLLAAGPSAPARAFDVHTAEVSSLRRQPPIKAGTSLDMLHGRCTAGAVLYRRDLAGRVTQQQRATRYVVTAAHCGDVGTAVYVDGKLLGAVTFASADLDYSIVTVLPVGSTSRHCAFYGSTPACYPITTYHPQAIGQVFVGGHGFAFAAPITVPGPREPQGHEDFCTSGAVGGWLCGFHSIGYPANGPTLTDRAAANYNRNISSGDSGGPVVDRDGHIMGIISSSGRAGSTDAAKMLYTSITTILRQLPSYALDRD